MFFNKNNDELNIYSQYFSGTDKSISKDEVGIVYPLNCNEAVKDTLTISSIIDHRNVCMCKLTEARVANANVETKELTYTPTRVVALEYEYNDDSELKSLLDIDRVFVYQSDWKITPKLSNHINKFLNVLSDDKLQAEMFIDSSNLTEKNFKLKNYTLSNGKYLFYQNDTLSKTDYLLIDEIIQQTLEYFETLDEKTISKKIKFLEQGIESQELNKLLVPALWGKKVNKIKQTPLFQKLQYNKEFISKLVYSIYDELIDTN